MSQFIFVACRTCPRFWRAKNEATYISFQVKLKREFGAGDTYLRGILPAPPFQSVICE